MDPAVVSQWVATVALIISIVNTVAVWVSRPGKIAKERHEALRDSVDKEIDVLRQSTDNNLKVHDRRIQALEGDQKHLPTKDDLHKLTTQVAKLEAEFKTELESVGHTVRRIDDYLRESRP